MRNNFPKQANFNSDLFKNFMQKNTKLIRALVFTALLVALTPAAYSAGFTTPGTSFEGVHISNRDKERNLNYSISIDSGEVVQGKRGFFRLGILPEIKINRLKLVLQNGTSIEAIASFSASPLPCPPCAASRQVQRRSFRKCVPSARLVAPSRL